MNDKKTEDNNHEPQELELADYLKGIDNNKGKIRRFVFDLIKLSCFFLIASIVFKLLWNACLPKLFLLPYADLNTMMSFVLFTWLATSFIKSAWQDS